MRCANVNAGAGGFCKGCELSDGLEEGERKRVGVARIGEEWRERKKASSRHF